MRVRITLDVDTIEKLKELAKIDDMKGTIEKGDIYSISQY